MDLIGKNPIPWPAFIAAKASLVGCWVFPTVRVGGWFEMMYDTPAVRMAGVILSLMALATAILSFRYLGRSLAMGLPNRETQLKTNGIYRFSRNPMYLSAFLLCAGSCFFAVHAVNILLCVTAVVLHLWIIRKEEIFLEQRFGRAWIEYKSRVPRFAGAPKGWRSQ